MGTFSPSVGTGLDVEDSVLSVLRISQLTGAQVDHVNMRIPNVWHIVYV